VASVAVEGNLAPFGIYGVQSLVTSFRRKIIIYVNGKEALAPSKQRKRSRLDVWDMESSSIGATGVLSR
jgi:hypothetical protein